MVLYSFGDFSPGLGGPVARSPGPRKILGSGSKCVKRVWVRVSAFHLVARKQNLKEKETRTPQFLLKAGFR